MSGQGLSKSERETKERRTFDRRSYLKALGATSSGLALGGLGLSETGIESAQAATTVIDDFEDGDLSEYSFDRGSSGASVVSSPAQSGSYALEYTGTNIEAISTSGLNAYPGAGDTFSFWVRASGGADNLNVTWGVQDHQNRYYAKLKPSSGSVYLFTYKSGSGSTKDSASGLSLSQDAWYEIEVDWASDGTQTVTLYDSGGSQLAQLSMTDTDWSSGGVGYDAYLASGEYAYFDYVTLAGSGGSSNSYTVDDFEDSDLSEYDFDRGSSGASVVSSPTQSGSYALEYTGANIEAISTSGLNAYPSAGDTFSFWVRASGGADNINVTWGVQGHTDRYYAKLKPSSGAMYLFTYKSGTGDQRDSASGLSLSQDAWYEIEVDWASDGTQTVTLYDNGGSQLTQLSMTDTDWSSGGVGYDAYLASGEYAYFDYVTLAGSGGSSNSYTVDDFEDGDLSEYTKHQDGTKTIVTDPTHTGSYAAELSETGEGYAEIRSMDGLDHYPVAGDTFSYWVDLGNISHVFYGIQDGGGGYRVKVTYHGDTSVFSLYRGTNQIGLVEFDWSKITGTWQEIEVQWGTDGTHVVTMYDSSGNQIVQVSGTDSQLTSGGIGYRAEEGTLRVDDVVISETNTVGRFETGLDGWTTGSDHQLTRASKSDQPGGVTEGDYCLNVQSGSSTPSIENEYRFEGSDPNGNPYLIGDVVGMFDNSNADLNLELKYHRSDGGSTETSPTVRLPQWEPGHVTWDLTELSADALDNPGRLELVWYPADQSPGSSFDYSGQLLIDNLRLTGVAHECSTGGMKTKMSTYKTQFGPMVDTIVDNETDTVEEGRFKYADGTEKNYRYEELDTDKYEMTIDGEVFKRGGGW